MEIVFAPRAGFGCSLLKVLFVSRGRCYVLLGDDRSGMMDHGIWTITVTEGSP